MGKSTNSNSNQPPTTSKTPHACCGFDIHIEAQGDVNINNNCSSTVGSNGKPDCGCSDSSTKTCPSSIGTCLPVVAGAKHKLSRDQKLAIRAANNPIPSAIAASILHCMRRLSLGKTAANPLEAATFTILKKLPADLVDCTVSAFDGLDPALRNKLFASSLLLSPDQAVDTTLLTAALATEIKQRAGAIGFNDPNAPDQERPGLMRLYIPSGEDFFSQVRICRVNNLRTGSFIPSLGSADYLPSELQQDCSGVLVNGQSQVVCQIRSTNCPGNQVAGVCGVVLNIAQGDSVELSGVNYFNVDAKVRLTDVQTQLIVQDVDAFVFGDLDTPVNEIVNGVTQLINDCRVHDKITFTVPDSLPPGVYWVQVVVPNTSGIPVFGDSIISNTEFINVLPPPNARYTIVTEKIYAREETSPAWWGSDEVGLHTISFGLDLNLQPIMPVQSIEFSSLLGDVEFDSGDLKDITTTVYQNDQPILGLFLSVLGYEIDSQHAYNTMIHDWTDYFVNAVEEQAKTIGSAILAIGVSTVIKLGWWGLLIAAIAALVVIAVDLIVSLWAPADLIIQDAIPLSILDIDALTSAAAPAPPASTYTTNGNIVVNINQGVPPVKMPFQYRETRAYTSSDQDSIYEITYRYNRLS
jgi:hypothetical protein